MKKILFYILFFGGALFINQSFGQIESPKEIVASIISNYGEEFKGNVNSIQYEKYSAKDIFGSYEKQKTFTSIVCNYDKNNRLIGFSGMINDESLESIGEINYITGEKSFEIIFSAENFKGNKNITDKIFWKYDSKGNIIEVVETENNNIKRKNVLAYSITNRLIEIKCYEKEGTLSKLITYKYNSKGNEVEKNSIENNEYSFRVVTTYNSSNKKIKLLFYSNNKLSGEYKFNYDKFGREIETSKHETNEEIVKYEYDKMGNWIKKIESKFENEKLIPESFEITERKIIYREN